MSNFKNIDELNNYLKNEIEITIRDEVVPSVKKYIVNERLKRLENINNITFTEHQKSIAEEILYKQFEFEK